MCLNVSKIWLFPQLSFRLRGLSTAPALANTSMRCSPSDTTTREGIGRPEGDVCRMASMQTPSIDQKRKNHSNTNSLTSQTSGLFFATSPSRTNHPWQRKTFIGFSNTPFSNKHEPQNTIYLNSGRFSMVFSFTSPRPTPLDVNGSHLGSGLVLPSSLAFDLPLDGAADDALRGHRKLSGPTWAAAEPRKQIRIQLIFRFPFTKKTWNPTQNSFFFQKAPLTKASPSP